MPRRSLPRRLRELSQLSRLAGALLLGIVVSWFAAAASEVPQPTSIEALKIGLSQDKQTQLITGWNSALTSGDPSLVIAAVDLLEFAPPELRARILVQAKASSALPTLFKSLDEDKRDLLIRSLFTYPELVSPLADALGHEIASVPRVRANLQYISDIIVALNRAPDLSPDIARALILGQPSIDDAQVRQTIASLLIAHAASLKRLETEIRSLSQSRNSDDHQLSIQLLMTMGAKVPDSSVERALVQPEGLQLNAIEYLGVRPEPLSTDDLKILIPILARPSSPAIWKATYETLAKRNPDLLNAFFTKYKEQFDGWAKLPAKTLVQILQSLPLEQSAELSTWPLIKSNDDSCDILVVNLLLVRRRALAKTNFSDGIWTTLQSKQSCSSSNDVSIPDLINQILNARPGGTQEFARFLSNRTQNQDWDNFVSGVSAETGWETVYSPGGSGSNALQESLSPALEKFLADRQEVKALDLLRIGVPYMGGATLLNSPDFVTVYKKPVQLGKENVIEMLGRLRHIPGSLSDEILTVAKDNTKTTTVRQAAIIALANSDKVETYFTDFVNIAQEPINLPSSAAIEALAILYRAHGTNLPDLSPTAPWLQAAATNQLTQEDTSRLLELLAIRNQTFGPVLLQSISDVTSYRCWDLAVLDKLPPRLWLTILDAGLATSTKLNASRACVMILTANQPDATLISAALTGQRSQNTPASALDRVALSSALESVWNQTSGLNGARAAIANQVDLLSSSLPYNVTSRRQLSTWSDRLKSEYPEVAQRISGEAKKQAVVLLLLGVPLIVVIHLLFWTLILLVYPHSATVQSIFFWNPIARKILALGYMDILLLSVPFVRRVLLAPLKEQMLGEVVQPSDGEFDRIAYFQKGRVRRIVSEQGEPETFRDELIFSALGKLRRRTLLLGMSGLGKSSFLRYSLYQKSLREDFAVYLPAGRCTGGVENAIAARVQLFSQDRDLLHSLIYAGRLEVYIDGYNEVGPATQEDITSFTAMFSKGRILVASQIPLRGLSRIETLELQPLLPDEIKEFLVSREPVLPNDCLIRGNAFRKMADMYLDDLWGTLKSSTETQAIEQVLSNPMDLTTTAIVLGNGNEPSLLALQEQQFEILQSRHVRKYQRAFRTDAFSEDVFSRRLENDEDLSHCTFDREVASLIEEKMAVTRAIEIPGKPAKQEILFRHDRIRDYFTHFAFLDERQDERRLRYANDSRFSGVYEYLAKVLDLGAAERLREQLLMRAVETQDHRLSDSFIRQLSWRQQFAAGDPAWLGDYDLTKARAADLKFDALLTERAQLEGQMLALKQVMSASRDVARILTTYEDPGLIHAASNCLAALGGTLVPADQHGESSNFAVTSPSGIHFTLAALGSRFAIESFHIELVMQRLKPVSRPVLLITNANVSVRPSDRTHDVSDDDRRKLLDNGLLCCSATDIYIAYKDGSFNAKKALWDQQESLWREIKAAFAAA
jgi:hypothetical protein